MPFPRILSAVLVFFILAIVACAGGAAPGQSQSGAIQPPASSDQAGGGSSPAGQEKVLRVGLPFLSQPPDPVKGGFQPVQTGLAETLFKLDHGLKPQPWLATGARQLNARSWEITLREDVTFHNGGLMDAAAVKASLERAIAESTRARVLLDIAKVEVNSPFAVTISTNNPSPILPAMLTELTSSIVDAAAAEVMGEAFTEKPVLTGPFKVERFQLDQELSVVSHQEYWGSPPKLDRAIYTYLPDNNSRTLALQSGDIDIAVNIAPESVATVNADSSLVVRSAPPIYLEFLYLNHRRESWKDQRVRQAIALAIDRPGLVQAVTHGQGTVASGPFPPIMLTCDHLPGYPFDPEQARELLGAAGYRDLDGDGIVGKDGNDLSMTLLTYRQRPELPPMAEAIQANLRQIGIQVNIQMVEQIDSVLQQGDWDGAMYFVTMGISGDPYLNLSQYFGTGGSANFGGYSSPRVDDLKNQLGVAGEAATRTELSCSASQVILEELPIIPLIYPSFDFGVSRKVTGFDRPHPFAWYFMDHRIGKD